MWKNKPGTLSVKKSTAWKKYQYCKTPERFSIYQQARNETTKQIRISKIKYEKDLAKKIKTNPKLFWTYVKSKTKTNTNISRVYTKDKMLTNTDQETANCMNDFFISVFTKNEPTVEPPMLEPRPFECMHEFIIDKEEVRKAIK